MLVSLLAYFLYFYNDRQYTQNLYKQNTFSLTLLSFHSLHLFFPPFPVISTLSDFLSFLILISSTLLHLSSTLFLFSSFSLSFLLSCSCSSHLYLFSLLLNSLSYCLLFFSASSFCSVTNYFCNSNIFALFFITCSNNLITSVVATT